MGARRGQHFGRLQERADQRPDGGLGYPCRDAHTEQLANFSVLEWNERDKRAARRMLH